MVSYSEKCAWHTMSSLPRFHSFFVFLSIRFIATLHFNWNPSSEGNLYPPKRPQSGTQQYFTIILVDYVKLLTDKAFSASPIKLKLKTGNGDGVIHFVPLVLTLRWGQNRCIVLMHIMLRLGLLYTHIHLRKTEFIIF